MSLWFAPDQLPSVPHQPPPGTLAHHLGMVLTAFTDDALHGSMPVDGRTRQVAGLLHGGASVALAETLMSAAAARTVDPSRHQVVGLEINANHLRGVREGHVHGVARALHRGRSTQVWSCELRDDAGALVCTARMTLSVLERQP